MSIKAKCPHCGVVIGLRDKSLIGKKIKCTKCNEPFKVEVLASEDDPPAKKKQAAPKRKKKKTVPADSDAFNEDEWDIPAAPMPAPRALPPRVQGIKQPPKPKPVEDDAAPKSSGSKKKNKKLIIALSCVGGILAWTGIMFALASGGTDVNKSPEVVQLEFTNGKSEQGKFSVSYPKDWTFETGGGSGGIPEWIRVETEDIRVSIKVSQSGSAIGDIANAGGGTEDLPEELAPVRKVHDWIKMKEMESEMNPYEETEPVKFETPLGDGRLSKFEGDRGFVGGGTAYGLRATLRCSPDYLKIVCTCESKRILEKYEDTLTQIVHSVGR